MNYWHVISSQTDSAFIKNHVIDCVTHSSLNVGDEIVVCAQCKLTGVYLRQNWSGSCVFCGGSKTLPFPLGIDAVFFSSRESVQKPDVKVESKTVFHPGSNQKKQSDSTHKMIALVACALVLSAFVIILSINNKKSQKISNTIPSDDTSFIIEPSNKDSNLNGSSTTSNIQSDLFLRERRYNLIAGFGDYFQYYISVNSNGSINALTGWDENWYQTVTSWTDIIEVDLGPWHTVGLKKDGTVVIAVNEPNPMPDESFHERIGTEWKTWSEIISVSAGNSFTIGLKQDGTVVASGFDGKETMQELVKDWDNIVAVSAGDGHVVGLRKNGTVVASGNNDSGQCNVSDWNDIIAVSAGWDMTIGLKSDGSVVAVGNNEFDACNVTGWNNITAISARGFETVGLKSDGTILIAGTRSNHIYDVSDWSDLTAVYTGNSIIAGLKADGTVLWAAGDGTNGVDYSNLRLT